MLEPKNEKALAESVPAVAKAESFDAKEIDALRRKMLPGLLKKAMERDEFDTDGVVIWCLTVASWNVHGGGLRLGGKAWI